MDNAGEHASMGSIPPVGHRTILANTKAPDGSEIRLLIDHSHGAGRASLVEVTLLAGQVSRPVWHRQVEEIWYVLEGHGQVWRCPFGIDPASVEPLAVGPGDALTIPTRWRFQFSTSSGEGLRFLCFTTPPWPGADEARSAETGGLGPPTV
jgi:mannose-6-phosphate isomerase-like protein (cupin superfamily)